MNSTFLSTVAAHVPMARPSALIRAVGVNGGATELMNTGMTGLAVMSP